jgi:hypothetical protein
VCGDFSVFPVINQIWTLWVVCGDFSVFPVVNKVRNMYFNYDHCGLLLIFIGEDVYWWNLYLVNG